MKTLINPKIRKPYTVYLSTEGVDNIGGGNEVWHPTNRDMDLSPPRYQGDAAQSENGSFVM